MSTASNVLSVSDAIDKEYHSLFEYPTFNEMQTIILPQALHADCNMVVAAPTGCGKTVVHELAILRLIIKQKNDDKHSMKVVYIAPNKALCQQKMNEWNQKYSLLGLKVLEITGDIDIKQSLRFIAMSSIIITTPEKWDSLTRIWKDHVFLLGRIDLLLIDEVHHLGEIMFIYTFKKFIYIYI